MPTSPRWPHPRTPSHGQPAPRSAFTWLPSVWSPVDTLAYPIDATSSAQRFPHQRLDAFYLAVAARRGTWQLLQALPPGYADDRRQLRRSSQAITKLIGEGASRRMAGSKRQRFEEALDEVGETAAGLEELALIGALEESVVDPVHELLGRTRAALLGILTRR